MYDRTSRVWMLVVGSMLLSMLLVSGCGARGEQTASDAPRSQTGTQAKRASAAEEATGAPAIPASNVTVLGLYATPTEAYEMWKADPKAVYFLDVRTFEEYVFGGHVEMAKNIPFGFPKYDPSGETMPGAPAGCSSDPNPDFVSSVEAAFGKKDKIFVMCSSGGRAAQAVNALSQAGFTRVYNVLNGFEGESVTDTGSAYYGKKMRNGWKNDGLPWGYDADPRLMWVEPSE